MTTSTLPLLVQVAPFMPDALPPLHVHFELVDWKTLPDQVAFCRERGADVRAVLTNGMVGLPQPCRDAFTGLGLIASHGVGYDTIDVAWAAQRGIRVTHTPDVLSADVADLAIGLALATMRQLPMADRFVRDGKWEHGPLPLGRRFSGSKVGVLGLGRIGRLVAQRAAAFDTRVAYSGRQRQHDVPYDYHPDPVSLANWAEVLIVVTPGGAATHHLVDAAVLKALGPNGVLVNVARGSVVDEAALIEALQAGTIAGAGLDVFADEPRVPAALKALHNVVLSPHMASATHQTRRVMAELVVANLLAFAAGEPLPTPVPESSAI